MTIGARIRASKNHGDANGDPGLALFKASQSGGMRDKSDKVPMVFVVDDDDFMRAALKQVFLAARIDVETFASARELLEGCDFKAPGVLLLDVMMPGMTGIELQAALRDRGVRLPVIFLTGSGDIPMAVAAMRNGAVDFLEKPFENRNLVERVRQALDRAAQARPAARVRGDYERRLATLTPREREVMDLMITGMTSKVIARELGGSFRTVEIHRSRVMAKMGSATLADLVRMTLEASRGD